MTNYPQVAVAVYQLATNLDPYLPQMSEEQALAWAGLFERQSLEAADLLAAVENVYATAHDTHWRLNISQIIEEARAIRHERRDAEQRARTRVELDETSKQYVERVTTYRLRWLRVTAHEARQAGDEAWAGELFTLAGILDVYGPQHVERRHGGDWFTRLVDRDKAKCTAPPAIAPQ
jgi:hypothetical protein